MESIEYKKGGKYRIVIDNAQDEDSFVIPAGCKIDSIVTKKRGTVAGNLSIGADAVYEVATLQITAGIGSELEIQSFSVTGEPTADGNITVDGETIAILDADDTDGVATKIRAHSFTNWDTSGTGSNVILTAKTYGDKALVVVNAGATGATFSAVSEDTAGSDLAGNVTVTLNGSAVNVPITNDDQDPEDVSSKIADEESSFEAIGFTVERDGDTLTFTSTSFGNKTDAIYNPNSTGATGSMTTSPQGVAGEGVVAEVALGTVDGAIAEQTVATPIQSMTADYTGTINIDSEAKCDVNIVMQVLN